MKQKLKAILLSRVSTPGQDTEAQSNELIRAAENDGYKWILIENKEFPRIIYVKDYINKFKKEIYQN